MKNQEDIKQLRETDDRQSEQLAILGNRQCLFNLKFRGLEENVGANEDLNVYMANWLPEILNIDVNNSLLLTQSYRIGRPNHSTKQFPRDVVSTFIEVQNRIEYQISQEKKAFFYIIKRKFRCFRTSHQKHCKNAGN